MYGLSIARQCLDQVAGKNEWDQRFKEGVLECWEGKLNQKDQRLPDPHIFCMSVASTRNERSIPHWGMYGAQGAGAALVFDGSRLKRRKNIDVVKVIYDVPTQKAVLTRILQKGRSMCVEARRKVSVTGSTPATAIYEIFAHLAGTYTSIAAAAIKHPDFRFEDEWRLVVHDMPIDLADEERSKLLKFSAHAKGNIVTSSYLLPIESRDLKGVIVGPSGAEFNEPVVRMLLRDQKLEKSTEVRIATTALRARPQ